MVCFEIEYNVRLSREEMWNLREDPAFLRWQYEHCADMSNLEIIDKCIDANDPDLVTVTWRITPSVPLPQFVLAYVGDGAGIYIEDVHQYSISRPYFIRFQSHPNMFQEYTETRGECEFLEEPATSADGQASTRVRIQGEVVVNVPIVGSYVESFVVGNLQSFYARFPDLVHSYMAAQSGAPMNEIQNNTASATTKEVSKEKSDEVIQSADQEMSSVLLAMQRSPASTPVALVPESAETVPEHVSGAGQTWWRWS
jgi:hypothetical protein